MSGSGPKHTWKHVGNEKTRKQVRDHAGITKTPLGTRWERAMFLMRVDFTVNSSEIREINQNRESRSQLVFTAKIQFLGSRAKKSAGIRF